MVSSFCFAGEGGRASGVRSLSHAQRFSFSFSFKNPPAQSTTNLLLILGNNPSKLFRHYFKNILLDVFFLVGCFVLLFNSGP